MIPFFLSEFHTFTKMLFREGVERFTPDVKLYPKEWKTTYFKTYDRSARVILPEPVKVNIPYYRLFEKRVSHRSFDTHSDLSSTDISTILHMSTREIDSSVLEGRGRRPTASAGARFPLETYILISRNIAELNRGLYHYRPDLHVLENIYPLTDETKLDLEKLFIDPIADTYPVIFFVTCVFERSTIKYQDRAYRYILLEAGAVGQAIQNAATLLEKRSLIFGGTFDNEVEKFLDIDGVSESLITTILLK